MATGKRRESELNYMPIYPVSCPLPTPSIFSFLQHQHFPSVGLEKERPATKPRFISKPANKTGSLASTGIARNGPSLSICCLKSDADEGNAGDHLPCPSTQHYFCKLQKDTVANRIRTWSAIEEEKGQMNDA